VGQGRLIPHHHHPVMTMRKMVLRTPAASLNLNGMRHALQRKTVNNRSPTKPLRFMVTRWLNSLRALQSFMEALFQLPFPRLNRPLLCPSRASLGLISSLSAANSFVQVLS
jgi:hypothetical protein